MGDSFHDDGGVGAAKTEGVGENGANRRRSATGLPQCRGPVSSSGPRKLMFGGRKECCRASRLKTASMAPAAPKECPIIPLVELTADFRSEKLGDGFSFRRVVERRGGAMGVDVVDRFRPAGWRACNACCHCRRAPTARRIWLSEVVVVGRDSVTGHFRQDFAPRARAARQFSRARTAAPSPSTIPRSLRDRRPAFVGRGCLQGIESDEDELGDRIVSAGQDPLISSGADDSKA